MVFYKDCTSHAPGRETQELIKMIDTATDVTRRTFLKHVDHDNLATVAEALGYSKHPSQGLTMAGDWHINYSRSTYYGRRVYFFKWSGIEHIFVPTDFQC